MSDVFHVQAFALFCENKTIGEIAKTCQVTRRTVGRWRKHEDWDRERRVTKHIVRERGAKKIRSEWEEVSIRIIKGMDEVSQAIFQQIRALAALGQHKLEKDLKRVKEQPEKAGGRKLTPFDYKLMADALSVLEERRLLAQRAILGEAVANDGDIICNVSITGIDDDEELVQAPALDPSLLAGAGDGGNGGTRGDLAKFLEAQARAVQLARGADDADGGNGRNAEAVSIADMEKRQKGDG